MSKTEFDVKTAARAAAQGISAACASKKKQELLTKCREYLKELSLSRPGGAVTADDASRWLQSTGETQLGPSAGGLFRTKEWAFTGEWVPSERVSHHTHHLRCWVFVGNGEEV